MTLHTSIVKTDEEAISSEKAKKFIFSEKNGAESIFIGKAPSLKLNVLVLLDIFIKNFRKW